MANHKIDCTCKALIDEQNKNIEEQSFAMQLLKSMSKTIRKMFIIIITILLLWAGTVASFVMYVKNEHNNSYVMEQTSNEEY